MKRLGVVLFALFVLTGPARAEMARGERGIAATVHPLATQAAIDAMKRGGNAVDAAVAAGLTLGVVDGYNSGIGGSAFLLIHRADGHIMAIDGRETAPAAAHRDMFIREGKPDMQLSKVGALASATPGALAAYEEAAHNFGRLPFRDHLLNAANIAEEGFPITSRYAGRIRAVAPELAKFDASRAIFLRPDGTPHEEDHILKQPDLARTYRNIARQGTGWFYGGPFARATERWMKRNGGILTVQDFKDYRAKFREPIIGTYRGHTVASFPPPSSGGIHLVQMLNMLEPHDVKSLGANSADMIHLVTEAMKLAFADRAHWLGDPDFAKVPRGLISKSYAALLAERIRMDTASVVTGHGIPDDSYDDVFGRHTTHFSVADAEGNWVACTATVNTSFGSKVVIPGTGVIMNNEMDDFSIQPGVPNHFGLIGAEANAVEPGKRPLSSMTPTILLKDEKPVLAVGAAGGPTIITQVLLATINTVDFGMNVREALAAPRFHHQWSPDELRIERRVDAEVMAGLERRGHKLNQVDSIATGQAVARDPETGEFTGTAEPRISGSAIGW